MWLIRADTCELEHFVGSEIPRYAALSHTWSTEEVLFKEIGSLSSKGKHGYRKIAMACAVARQAGLQYVWVDTCCIDKSSSAELTEAINSMYRWYERSQICVVYLEDLSVDADLDVQLRGCRWFTRGWTLQELVAPTRLYFYDQDWKFRGSKQDLVDKISSITGIGEMILQKCVSLSSISVARKLSWAAYRQTTRIEDMAYCLLGIFDINMPLLYGEEEKAFRRLQVEIINSAPDLSIFAWKVPTDVERPPERCVYSGLLAESPLAFAGSQFNKMPFSSPQRDFSVTNIGIKSKVQVVSEEIPGKQGHRYILPLDCCATFGKPLGIRLRKCGPDQFLRDNPGEIIERDEFLFLNAPRERYFLTRLEGVLAASNMDVQPPQQSDFSIANSRSHVLQTQLPESIDIYDAWSWGRYDDEDQVFFVQSDETWDSGSLRLRVTFDFEHRGRKDIHVSFDCMFFAIGWSATKGEEPLQCSIMEYSPLATNLSDIQSQLVDWDPDRFQVIDALKHHKIPKSSTAAVEVPGTKFSTLVSFKLRLIKDPEVCRNEFWRVEFFCDVHETRKLPKPSWEDWHGDVWT